MKKFIVLLAPNWNEAKKIQPHVTVEAEYGEDVLEGSLLTLAHHSGAWAGNPAPCNTEVAIDLPDGAVIVVSHIDLDTIGGIMAATGQKVNDNEFWEAAEYIDLYGHHHGHKFPKQLPKLQAYWAWTFSQPHSPRVTENTDVTETVLAHIDAITHILHGDSELLKAGPKWAAETSAKIEGCLIEEDDRVRVFATDDIFCGATYLSPGQGQLIPMIVSYNTKFGTITVSMEVLKNRCKSTIPV